MYSVEYYQLFYSGRQSIALSKQVQIVSSGACKKQNYLIRVYLYQIKIVFLTSLPWKPCDLTKDSIPVIETPSWLLEIYNLNIRQTN